MNVLMIGVGDAGLDDPDSDSVQRFLEYARRIDGRIDLIVDSPNGGISEYGSLTVCRTGTGRTLFPAAAHRLGLAAARKTTPDVIASQDPFATALAGLWLRRTLQRPLLIQNHSSVMFNPRWTAERPVLFRALHLLARLLLHRADAWRVVNTRERRVYLDRLGLPADRVRVLPVPCDLAAFSGERMTESPARTRKRLRIPPDAPLLAWAGRPVRFKRLPLLFQAFAEIRARFPAARLVVVGRKALAQEDLDRAARRAGLGESLTWSGELDHKGLADLLRAADVFLYSSVYEGFGRVLVEAGASGLPAVATSTAGAADIIRDGETGFLVPVEDAPALARRAGDLLADREARRRMGAAARKRIRSEFAPEKLFDGIISQWRETVAAGMRP
jgi:glycosyltransferase involved in cell wall biosynthesis